MNSVTYVEKNHISCEWLDGIPNSVPMWTRLIGLGSRIQCFNIILLTSFTKVPIKRAIWNVQSNKQTHPRILLEFRFEKGKMHKFYYFINWWHSQLTVCKSLRNSINVTKPAPMPMGAKLIHANSWPNRSPTNWKEFSWSLLQINALWMSWRVCSFLYFSFFFISFMQIIPWSSHTHKK